MQERLTYWKCPCCHGTGKIVIGSRFVEKCFSCGGTGNALVDGQEQAHRRQIVEIERGQ